MREALPLQALFVYVKSQGGEMNRKRRACKAKFKRFFREGYRSRKYVDWERGYKWDAHLAWNEQLAKGTFQTLLDEGEFEEIAQRAVRIETKTNLLFSFEKMALRDAVKPRRGAEAFARGLYEYVYGTGSLRQRFEQFTPILEGLPRKQTRVLTWPLHTVFGMIGKPKEHIFLKPVVTKIAAEEYDFDFVYKSRPNWETYRSLLDFAEQVREDTADLGPRDMIDLQSFIWVQGSGEYEE